MAFFDIDRFKEILDTLSRNRGRTLLTGFGVFWGIFMLLALMGGGQGLKAIVGNVMEGFATNSAFIGAGQTQKPYKGFRSGRSWQLSTSDIELLRERIPGIETISGTYGMWGQQATYGDHSYSCQASGVDPDYARIQAPKMGYGRYISGVDVEMERKVCVLGKRVYHELFPAGGDPCGEVIQLAGLYFKVIGVDMSDANISIDGPSDQAVTIPISVVQKIFNRGSEIDVICMTARPGVKIKDILAQARPLIARAHSFDPTDRKAMFELNAEEMFSIVDNLFKGINLLIWLVGFGTLLAAAIGVSNIMMVTVKERTSEIGIRRAIGATPRMILSQIMLESVILTFVAGMLGIVMAVLSLSLADIAAASSEAPAAFQVSFGSAVLAVLILTVLGLLAGLAPATRAMAIKPVDAIADE